MHHKIKKGIWIFFSNLLGAAGYMKKLQRDLACGIQSPPFVPTKPLVSGNPNQTHSTEELGPFQRENAWTVKKKIKLFCVTKNKQNAPFLDRMYAEECLLVPVNRANYQRLTIKAH